MKIFKLSSAFSMAFALLFSLGSYTASAEESESKSKSKSKSTGEFTEDSAIPSNIRDRAISAKVKAALYAEPDLKSSGIQVMTNNGEVQLTGAVSSQPAKAKAVEISRNVEGVKSVQDDMQLK
jgi:osmotically-inducible protein OsmY